MESYFFFQRSTSLGETEHEFLKQNQMKEQSNEILLSNCSLNSSSSGSSRSSFENKTCNNEPSEQWGTNKQFLNGSGSSLNVTLTPSESTSELSVMSINNFSSSNSITKKSNTLLNKGLKPSVSTGAIPKSISFDMSADKGLNDDSRSKRGGFFGKLRMGFRRGKSMRNQEDFKLEVEEINKRQNESPVKINSSGMISALLCIFCYLFIYFQMFLKTF